MNRSAVARTAVASALFGGAALLASAAPVAGQVFTCVDASGRTLTSDRLIAQCMDREQRVLGKDGTLIRIVPPQLTADERAEKEARERRAAAEREAKAEAVKRDRNLLQRYPDEAAHQKGREAALEDIRAAIKVSELRQQDLARERKPLLEEAEFYKGKTLPPKLKQQLDANDAATTAQADVQNNQKAELDRISKVYDAELARLKKLWAGAAPGSLGPAAPEAPPVKPAVASNSVKPEGK
jgi:hypothetical protein